jgi:hypothetical protein
MRRGWQFRFGGRIFAEVRGATMSDHDPIPNGHHRCPSADGRFVPDPDCGRDEYAVARTCPRPTLQALPPRAPATVIELAAYREARA